MSTTLLLIAAYFLVLAGVSAAAMPYRRRMRKLGAELCAADISDRERGLVESMLKHAYSWRMSLVLFLVYLAGVFQAGEALEQEAEGHARELPVLSSDPRFHRFADSFFVSVVGVNPVFGVLAILAKHAFRLKMGFHHTSKGADRIADLRAASTV